MNWVFEGISMGEAKLSVGSMLFSGHTLICSRCFKNLEPTECRSVEARPEQHSGKGRVCLTTICVACQDRQLNPKKS